MLKSSARFEVLWDSEKALAYNFKNPICFFLLQPVLHYHKKVDARRSMEERDLISHKETKAMKEILKLNIKQKPSEEKAVCFIYKMTLILT